jgi:hypothetical protein
VKADRMTADQVLQDIADYVIDYKVVSEWDNCAVLLGKAND